MNLLQTIRKKSYWLVEGAKFPARGIYRGFSAIRYSFLPFAEEAFPDTEAFEVNDNYLPSEKQVSFTFAVISLSAHVAKVDGAVNQAEYLAFRDSFPLTGGVCGKIRELFSLACKNHTPTSQNILQINTLFPKQNELFIALVDRLFRIAIADKPLVKEEEILLAKIARNLGLSPAEYSELHEKYSRPPAPHEVLGVKRRSKREIIKQRYYTLMKRYHPDRFATDTVSPEVNMILTLKTKEISDAYRDMTRKAG